MTGRWFWYLRRLAPCHVRPGAVTSEKVRATAIIIQLKRRMPDLPLRPYLLADRTAV